MKINGIIPGKPKLVKCPKCGNLQIFIFSCTKPFAVCKKCGNIIPQQKGE
ncbi:hypothetical protein OFO01_06105 [Campylobacter sp. JMF_01 NE2]|nr:MULTISPECIES: hypothetical protein [unclassified Campylobacter]MDA3042813.1 hypothetical protein [Campylobacter sp. JMF_09 ED2]MDA3044352.1 hypothetical protein [Campylobacter sp. JMF_07 ED4]MDA3046150.1 hypothetical protein [Campylobacter sp. VBCF_06 NA8]MDA3053026.1 hypothetical protein [Campylobacter sp. JMF_03 NE3]MDA3054280.1 hypothetical protein [Campylobacter sp. VBCF_07 NA4]